MFVLSKKLCTPVIMTVVVLSFLISHAINSGHAADIHKYRLHTTATMTPEQIRNVIQDHAIWLNTYRDNLLSSEAQNDKHRGILKGTSLLRGADLLRGVDLRGADLMMAILCNANLSGTNLSGADMTMADLSGTYLNKTDLSGTILNGADLSGAVFEPKTLTDIGNIAFAKNLELMRYQNFPGELYNLRKSFKDAGFYEQERKITYAIKHYETMKLLMHDGAVIEGVFNYIFFDCTTKWGMAPGRALLILIVLIQVFAIPYVIALNRLSVNGIWRKWSDDRMRTNLGTRKPMLLRVSWHQAIRLGWYFSFLSAFNIGWRELNVGNWIQRLQPNEYTLRATGWVRTVSGIQSLISVFLLAIWVLTYFGRPFE